MFKPRALPGVFAALLAIAIAPIWIVRYHPLPDLANHLAAMAVWTRMDDPAFDVGAYYEVKLGVTPYWGYYAPMRLLVPILGLDVANRVVLSLYAATVPIGFAWLAHRLGRSAWLGLFGFAFIGSFSSGADHPSGHRRQVHLDQWGGPQPGIFLQCLRGPREFTVQGVLRDGTGRLQSTPVNLEINFFDVQPAGTGTKLAGPYQVMNVPVEDGLFTATIVDNQIINKIGSVSDLWLEVTIGAEVFSRQRVTPTGFALIAARAESLACSGCIDNTMISGVAASKVSGKVASAMSADTAATATNATNATNAGTAAALSCTGCVSGSHIGSRTIGAGNVALGAFTHGHGLSISTTSVASISVGPLGLGENCATCPTGTQVVSGNCSTVAAVLQVNSSYRSGNAWCCRYYNPDPNGGNTASVSANCLSINSASIP